MKRRREQNGASSEVRGEGSEQRGEQGNPRPRLVRKGGLEPPRSRERQALTLIENKALSSRPRPIGVGSLTSRGIVAAQSRVSRLPLHRVAHALPSVADILIGRGLVPSLWKNAR